MNPSRRPFTQRGLTLQVLVLVILPLTLLLVVIAVGSIAAHQQAMRAAIPEGAQRAPLDPALEITLVAPLVLLAPLLFALAALFFGARQIVQPLQRLEQKAAAVGAGDYETIQESVGGISEVQSLQAALASMARKVEASQSGLRDYIGAITSAQEEERLRLARELHDETIQELIALKQRVQLAAKVVGHETMTSALTDLERLAEETIHNVRRMTRALRPIYLEDLGLVPALEMLVNETAGANSPEIEFHKQGSERRLSREVELAIYRIVQQALSNIVRHAQAQHAAVELAFSDADVHVLVRDDGVGFQLPRFPTDLAPNGHFGLIGMRERADLIGARLELESTPGRGTRLIIRLPLKRAEMPS